MRTSLILVFLISFISSSFSQSYYFDSYGVKQGLSNSDVYTISQDRQGYVWLGTKSGISKFDGSTFENFYSDEGTAANGMRTIYRDTTDGVWFGHIGGGLTYYKGGVFQSINLDSISHDITSIVEDNKHRLWIATYGSGVYRVNNPYNFSEGILIDHFSGAEGLSDRVSSISSTTEFGLLFITDFGGKYYDEESQKFEFIKNIIPEWPEYFPVICVFEDSRKNLWVGTYNGGLYKFMDSGRKLKVYDQRDGLALNWVSYLYEDSNQDLWIGTWGGGVSLFRNNKFETFNSQNGLEASIIRCIYQDYEGNILIGSKNKGLFIYKGDAFVHFSRFQDNKAVQVNSILQSENKEIWFGSNNGIWISNIGSQNEILSVFNVNAKIEENLKSNNIRHLLSDQQHNIWIGTWGGGVTKFDRETNEFLFPYYVNRYITEASKGNVTAMTIDKSNNLFVGANEGLVYYEINEDKIDFLTQTHGLAGNDITALYTATDGVVWVGARNKGLSTIDGAKIEIVNSSFNFTPTCITEDSQGAIWIGTEGLGILYVADGEVSKKFGADKGLISGIITSLITDNNDNLLIGTPNGLVVYNSELNQLFHYGEKEGFVGIEVRPNAVYKNKGGAIWFGTVSGTSLLNPEKLKYNAHPPRTSITRVRVELKDQDLYTPLNLHYTLNSVLIDYKGICISNSDKVRYKVKMEGADHDWQPITDQTFANYPSLSPGKYTFRIMAMNNSGIWSENTTSFKFKIRPPFWQTLWFYALVIILGVALIVVYVRVRERALLKEKAELEEKVEERTLVISEKNNLLAKKNKDIMDSINYARRIQSAMMPAMKNIESYIIPNGTVYYKPKDVVSGDFYWGVNEGGCSFIAAADCTGHGVPGAFMSMISISALNKIVKEKKILDPATILNELRRNIIEDLTQGGGGSDDTKDGLDIALLSIDYSNNMVEYAGAYNSLYIIKKDEFDESELEFDYKYTTYKNRIIEVKADRMPIGISERMDRNFTTRRVKVESGDMLVISTDGYIDQFGGDKGGKLMSKRFKQLLLEIPNNNSKLAYNILNDRFLEWRGDFEQIDDVLVIGISF